MTTTPAPTYSITDAARMAGVTPMQLRAWSTRYGWPSPRRSPAGYRRFTAREIELLRCVVAEVRAGRPVRDVLGSGYPDLRRVPHPPSPLRVDLDLSSLAAPTSTVGTEARGLLLHGLIHRHGGCVRWAIQLRARIPPADRETAIDGVLRLAVEQLGHPGWLLEAMHA